MFIVGINLDDNFGVIYGLDPRFGSINKYFYGAFKNLINRNLNPLIYIQAYINGGGFCTYFKHPDDLNNLIDRRDSKNLNFSKFAFWVSKHMDPENASLFSGVKMTNFGHLITSCKLLSLRSMESMKRKAILCEFLKYRPWNGRAIISYAKLQYKITFYQSRICMYLLDTEDIELAKVYKNIEVRILFLKECSNIYESIKKKFLLGKT